MNIKRKPSNYHFKSSLEILFYELFGIIYSTFFAVCLSVKLHIKNKRNCEKNVDEIKRLYSEVIQKKCYHFNVKDTVL